MFESAMLPAMGNNLKMLRTSKGMTQDRAADAMGVSKGQYVKLERSERRLTLEYINQAAKAFGVTVSEVVAGLDANASKEAKGQDKQPRPDISAKLFSLFAEISRLEPDEQAQIIAVIVDALPASRSHEQQVQNSSHD
ncbi:MAG: helix-turn-helix transcriptional regulator [Agrobacterium cavarae]|uniref:helix-turn-helix domain-containing protein n=1 Tax=Agrobacterium cavarae TaxID=2528239 RepID=UPI0031A65D88